MIKKRKLKSYYRKIKRHLVCSKSSKQGCMDDFSAQLEEYLHEAPQTTIKEIHAIFGSPKVVAQNYQEQLAQEEVKKYKTRALTKNRCLKAGVIVTAILSVLMFFTMMLKSRVDLIVIEPAVHITTYTCDESQE